ncbi:MAG: ribosome small subunit-dependent GTPase A [Paludibacteraceae bacterium]|nr:ribosome small subunit-dependent GTPase A [Paludibacteraceae bacterium]
MRGLIITTTGSAYRVLLDKGETIEAHVKGNFRVKGIRSTNPVAVGDYVQVETLPDGTNWITDIDERRNYIIRRSTNLSRESHILAANIDQVALIVTLHHPITSTTFIDRFLATAEAYRVPALLIFNKIDLLSSEQQQELDALRNLYESIGYSTLAISAIHLTENNAPAHTLLNTIAQQLSGKVTLLSGNSGVGKSTILNALLGEQVTRTGKISDAHDKGMHTTTFSAMYPLRDPLSGWIIDTPGIKGFGAVQMEKEEISHYFRELFAVGRNCRYSNCLHTNEPGCAVHEAVIQNKIAISRYESYLSLLGDVQESKYR